MLRSLALQATLALENVELHLQVSRVGEKMALILPHTDLEGSYAIAERVRSLIKDLGIPRLDQHLVLRITASFGVSASSEGHKDALTTEADRALYAAKPRGKNRSVTARAETANVFTAE